MARLGPAAIALAAALPFLAGCISDAPPAEMAAPSPFTVGAGQLQADRFYAFDHAGGTLSFRAAAASAATLTLYDGDDRRVGGYTVGGGEASSHLRLDGLREGRYVLHLVGRNGTLGGLSMDGPAGPILLWPLQAHVERHLIAQRSRDAVPPIPFVPRDVLRAPLHLNLTHAPTAMAFYTDGTFGELHLKLSSPAGDVFRSDWGGAKFDSPFYEDITELPGTFHAERVRGPQLDGQLDVQDLQGALLLDALGYSRVLPAGGDLVSTRPSKPSSEYGLLPPRPVAFHVSPEAKHLVLWNDLKVPAVARLAQMHFEPSWVAIYDPQDRKVASAPVFPGVVTTVEVQGGGEYVAVLLSGNATLGADAAAPELGLTPMDVLDREVPQKAAGQAGEYGQANEILEVQGVLFDIQPTEIREPLASFPQPQLVCPPQASLRIEQGGELLAAWGPQWQLETGSVGALLDGSAVSLWHDGFGASECPRTGAKLLSYVR